MAMRDHHATNQDLRVDLEHDREALIKKNREGCIGWGMNERSLVRYGERLSVCYSGTKCLFEVS